MDNRYRTFLPCLIALLFLAASCAPRYGAHFAPGKTDNYAKAQKETVQTPLVAAESPAAEVAVDQRSLESGATEVIVEPAAPVASPEKAVSVELQQKAVLKELRKKLKGMSKAERKEFQQQVLHQLKEQQLAMQMAQGEEARFTPPPATNINMVLLAVVTFFIPPLGVFIHQGEINSKFWISLVLTLLLWLPGMIYSMLVIFDQI